MSGGEHPLLVCACALCHTWRRVGFLLVGSSRPAGFQQEALRRIREVYVDLLDLAEGVVPAAPVAVGATGDTSRSREDLGPGPAQALAEASSKAPPPLPPDSAGVAVPVQEGAPEVPPGDNKEAAKIEEEEKERESQSRSKEEKKARRKEKKKDKKKRDRRSKTTGEKKHKSHKSKGTDKSRDKEEEDQKSALSGEETEGEVSSPARPRSSRRHRSRSPKEESRERRSRKDHGDADCTTRSPREKSPERRREGRRQSPESGRRSPKRRTPERREVAERSTSRREREEKRRSKSPETRERERSRQERREKRPSPARHRDSRDRGGEYRGHLPPPEPSNPPRFKAPSEPLPGVFEDPYPQWGGRWEQKSKGQKRRQRNWDIRQYGLDPDRKKARIERGGWAGGVLLLQVWGVQGQQLPWKTLPSVGGEWKTRPSPLREETL